MKKVAAIIAACVVSTSAVAGEKSWSGLFVGVHGGYASGDWDGVLSTTAGCPSTCPDAGYNDHSRSVDLKGMIGGLQVGYNWRSGGLVLGVEADASFSSVDGSDSFATDTTTTGVWDKKHSLKLDHFGTARVKIGVPVGGVLFYGTGGLAWGRTSADIEVAYYNTAPAGATPFGISGASTKENHVGWTIGGGAEWAITDSISFKAEYLYVDLGSADYRFTGGSVFNIAGPAPVPAVPFGTDAFKSDINLHTVRAGLNFRF